jgi:hypothetical protein
MSLDTARRSACATDLLDAGRFGFFHARFRGWTEQHRTLNQAERFVNAIGTAFAGEGDGDEAACGIRVLPRAKHLERLAGEGLGSEEVASGQARFGEQRFGGSDLGSGGVGVGAPESHQFAAIGDGEAGVAGG